MKKIARKVSFSGLVITFEVIPGISGTYELFAAYGYSGEILDVFSLYSNVAHEKMVLSE